MERQYQILMVDNNPDLLNTYGQFLTQQGFQVDTAQVRPKHVLDSLT